MREMTWEEWGEFVSSLYPDMRNLYQLIGTHCRLPKGTPNGWTDWRLQPFPFIRRPVLAGDASVRETMQERG